MEEDGLDPGHNPEIMAYIALPKGTGSFGTVQFEAIATQSNVMERPYSIRFRSPFVGVPGLFGSIASFNGGDPSHLRQVTPRAILCVARLLLAKRVLVINCS